MTTLLTATPYVGEAPDDSKLLMHRIGEDSAESITPTQLKYPIFTSTGVIDLGDVVVLNTDGTVEVVDFVAGSGFDYTTKQLFTTTENDVQIKLVALTPSLIVAGYLGTDNIGRAKVGTVSGSVIVWDASEYVIGDTAHATVTLQRITSTTFVFSSSGISWRAAICTVLGTTISPGTLVDIRSSQTTTPSMTYNSPTTITCLCEDSGNNLAAYVATYSGDTITSVAGAVNLGTTWNPTATTCDYLSDDIIWLGYCKAATSYVRRATISGSVLTGGTQYSFSSSAAQLQLVVYDNAKIVIAYIEASVGKARVATLSGEVPTFGTAFTFDASNVDIARLMVTDTDEVAIVYTSINGDIVTKRLLITGTGLSDIDSASTSLDEDVAALYGELMDTNGTIAISYQELNNSYLEHTVVRKSEQVTTADEWIGIAQDTVADAEALLVAIPGTIDKNQTGMTPGDIQYIADNGVISDIDSGRKIGKALSATSILIGE